MLISRLHLARTHPRRDPDRSTSRVPSPGTPRRLLRLVVPLGAVTLLVAAVDPPATAATSSPIDLFAETGAASLDTAAVPVWGFGTSGAPVTRPGGPTLTVQAGSPVTITLHNGLPADAGPLALAIPQLAGVPTDLAGAAPGATTSYTFTPGTPGTYLYEAGHTANGPVQAVMGLYGALVVLPASGTNAAYANGAGAFDDSAVAVLSEVDPVFNAAPMASKNLRTFTPGYRLINGLTAPAVPPVPTAPGHTLLIRYLNAGTSGHSMTVLGLDQALSAVDAQQQDPVTSSVVRVDPGQTDDAFVQVPTTPGLSYPLYEAGSRLDDMGALAGGQVASGGMLTTLDTSGAGPVTPSTAPTVGAVQVTPAASATGPFAVTATVTPAASSGVAQAEYVLDSPDATAPGSGTPMTVTGTTASASIPKPVAAGRHTVYVRAASTDPTPVWSTVSSAVLVVATFGPITSGVSAAPALTSGGAVTVSATGDDTAMTGTVDGARMVLSPPGGTALAPVPMGLNQSGQAVSAETVGVPAATVATLPEGTVGVSVATHDSFGVWGAPATTTLVVDRTPPTLTAVTVDPAVTSGQQGTAADAGSFRVDSAVQDPNGVAAAEVFLDKVGAPGTGAAMLAGTGGFGGTSVAVHAFLPLSQLNGLSEGPHAVYVEGKDAAGNWGGLIQGAITVDRGLYRNAFESRTVAGDTALPWDTSAAGAVLGVATSGSNLIGGTASLTVTGQRTATGFVTHQYPGAGDPVTGRTFAAQVLLRPGTLAAGAGVDVMTLTGPGGTPARLVLRRTGTATSPAYAVRACSGTSCTGWVSLSATIPSTLRLGYRPATAGGLVLSVNGVPVTGVTPSTTSGVVTGVRLGLVATNGVSVSGAAGLDGFTSAGWTVLP